MKNKKEANYMWTKDNAKKVVKLWDKTTPAALAEEIGCSLKNINYLRTQLRKIGIKLTAKRRVGHMQIMLRELKEEIKKLTK